MNWKVEFEYMDLDNNSSNDEVNKNNRDIKDCTQASRTSLWNLEAPASSQKVHKTTTHYNYLVPLLTHYTAKTDYSYPRPVSHSTTLCSHHHVCHLSLFTRTVCTLWWKTPFISNRPNSLSARETDAAFAFWNRRTFANFPRLFGELGSETGATNFSILLRMVPGWSRWPVWFWQNCDIHFLK